MNTRTVKTGCGLGTIGYLCRLSQFVQSEISLHGTEAIYVIVRAGSSVNTLHNIKLGGRQVNHVTVTVKRQP